jgi:hypothetical protein
MLLGSRFHARRELDNPKRLNRLIALTMFFVSFKEKGRPTRASAPAALVRSQLFRNELLDHRSRWRVVCS